MNWTGFFMVLAYLFVSSMIIRMLASFTNEKMGVVTMEAIYLVVGAFLPVFILSLIIDSIFTKKKSD